jgi:LemA protein
VADNDERIRRMEVDGVLTPRQAEMLRSSLAPAQKQADSAGRRFWTRKRSRLALWTAFGFLALAVVAAAFVTGGPREIQDVAATLNEAGGHGEMNRTVTTLLSVSLLFVLPLLFIVYVHNSLVSKEEAVSRSWAQVESSFQRRADLIPALVQTVSRYLRHERETLVAATEARDQQGQRLTEAIDSLIAGQKAASDILRDEAGPLTEDEERLKRLAAAGQAVEGHMAQVFAVAEAYPDLRSADQFIGLQAQIEGTENRINVARQRFNEDVGEFNATMRMMPWNIVAGLGGFNRKAYFRSEDEARNAPALAFD